MMSSPVAGQPAAAVAGEEEAAGVEVEGATERRARFARRGSLVEGRGDAFGLLFVAGTSAGSEGLVLRVRVASVVAASVELRFADGDVVGEEDPAS